MHLYMDWYGEIQGGQTVIIAGQMGHSVWHLSVCWEGWRMRWWELIAASGLIKAAVSSIVSSGEHRTKSIPCGHTPADAFQQVTEQSVGSLDDLLLMTQPNCVVAFWFKGPYIVLSGRLNNQQEEYCLFWTSATLSNRDCMRHIE